MSTRLVLAGLALVGLGALGATQAHDAGLAPLKRAAQSAREASPVVEVQQRRRKRVSTRRTSPDATETPAGRASNGEVLFGVQDVGFLVDRDVIRVGSEIGKFDRVRLRVLRNDIFVTDLKAVFADGQTETLITDEKIGANRKTDWIPLKHKGFIKEIQMVYRSRPDFKGQARVEVFGEYAPGWLGPNGEGRKYNDGWVLLGTDTAGSVGFDRVTIPVGSNEGGFKRLRVTAKDRDITMTKLEVIYADGGKDEIDSVRTKIAADEPYGPVDLKQNAAIKEIQATWRSRALATSKRERAYATVQVWAQH